MSSIGTNSEDLVLNADGSSSEIKLKIDGTEKASISSAGAFTSTTIDATKLTGALPAISGANLTGLSSFDPDGAVVINDSGADVDFRVESDTNANALFVHGADGNVGINDTSPGLQLTVEGTQGAPATTGSTQTGIFRIQNSNNNVLDFGNIQATGTAWLQATYSPGLTNNYAIALNPNGGKVGIGTSAPVALLSLGGDINAGQGDTEACSGIAFQTSSHDDQFQIKTVGGSNNDQRGLLFLQNGSERMRMIGNGGLTFNGDTATANALNDYEEGTWTPTSNTGSINSSADTTYTKIGRQVTIRATLTFTNVTTASAIYVEGLPFATTGATAAGSAMWSGIDQDGAYGTCYANNSQISFYDSSSDSGWRYIKHNQLDATNSYVYFHATYIV